VSRFFAYIARMKNIRRWGLMRSFSDENIQEHSLQVAMIAHALAILENKRYGANVNPEHVMAIAMYHETAEVITGDLVTPIKYYNEDIKHAYKEIEKKAEERMISMLPADLHDEIGALIQPSDEEAFEKQIVKGADKLAAYAKCLEELRSGNREFEKAKETLEATLNAMPLGSVHDFMVEFMPSFSKTLDELN